MSYPTVMRLAQKMVLSTEVTVGIDIGSKKISWSRFVGGELKTAGAVEVLKSYRAREIDQLMQAIETPMVGADVVMVEEPLVGRAVRASLLVAQTAGAALAQAERYCPDAHIDLADNKAWKKAIVGNGGAKKEEISQWLEQQHGDWFERFCIYDRPKAGRTVNQDVVDAICIGLYGIEVSTRTGSYAQGEAV